MAMFDGLRMLLLVLALLTVRLNAAPSNDEALRQIPKLNHGQVALIARNATARCNLWPELCDWQLHLYEGHAFSIQLPQSSSSKGNNKNDVASTVTTTSAPRVKTEPIPVIFTVPGIDNKHNLLIYAQVERRPKLAKRRRRKLLANIKLRT